MQPTPVETPLFLSKAVYFVAQHSKLLLLSFGLALVTGVVSHFQWTLAVDRLLYDWGQRFSSVHISDDIVIIEIDDKSISQIGRWPWPRSTHAQLIHTLAKAENNTLVFDVLFADEDTQNPASDQQLQGAMQEHGNTILPMHIEKLGQQGQVIEVLPIKSLTLAAAAIGHVHVAQDSDGVTRSVFLKQGVETAYWSHLSIAVLQTYQQGQFQRSNRLPGAISRDSAALDSQHIIARNFLNYIPVNPRLDESLTFSYSDVLSGAIPPSTFENKLVFIGATATGLGDVLTTSVGNLEGVKLNVWIFEALRQNKLIERASPAYTTTLNFIGSFFLLVLLGRLAPKALLIATAATAVSIVLLSLVLQNGLHFWLLVSPMLLSLAVFYPLWNWLRLEVAVNFLKSELHDLNEEVSHSDRVYHQAKAGLDYLQAIGIIERWEINTFNSYAQHGTLPASKRSHTHDNTFLLETPSVSITAYPTEHYLSQLPEEWNAAERAQILFERFYSPSLFGSQSLNSGAEIISQTVAQLSAIKRSAETNSRLVKRSLAKLQDGVIIANLYGSVMFTNTAFDTLVGKQSYAGLNLIDVLEALNLADDKSWKDIIAALYCQKKSISGQALRQNNTHPIDLYFQARTENIYSDFEDTIIITFTNISEIRAAERAKMEALNFLSHDLRAPMLSVLAIIERNNMPGEITSKSTQDAFDNIAALVRQNLNYAEDFLQLSRAKTLTEAQFHYCDLHAVFDGAHKNALGLAKSKCITIQANKEDSDAWAMGDHTLLERALTNLLSNAVKYSSPNSRIGFTLATTAEQIILTVSDTGVGIAKQDLDSIFERFTRATTNNNEHGSGLGLYFASLVAQQHGGEITVTSEQGVGSEFQFKLPKHSE